MPDATAPGGPADDSTLSFDDGVDAISDLMLDPEETPDLKAKDEAHGAEATADEPTEEAEGEGAEDEARPDEKEDGEQDDDGPEEVGGGKFAADSAKVTLKDGTVISVQDLKRGFLSQQAFTRGTTELAQERKQLAEHKAQLAQIAKSLAQQRDFVLQTAQQFMPKAPDRALMDSDPIGYMQAKAEYDDRMQVVSRLMHQRQAETGRMTQEQTEARKAQLAEEARKLVEVIPEFRDQKVYGQFWNDATSVMSEHYGYTPEELSQLATDHRLYIAMRDLVRYRKALKKAPAVKQEVQAKPKMLTTSRRMDPKAKTSRSMQARSEELRKTGSFEAGVAALMDLDL